MAKNEKIDERFQEMNEQLGEVSWFKNKIPNFDDVYLMLRMFEINFDKHKDYDMAGEFYKKRLELQRGNDPNILRKSLLTLYKWFSSYGENYLKPIVWAVIFIAIFTAVYLVSGVIFVNSEGEKTLVSFLHSKYRYNFFDDLGCAFLYSLNSSTPFRQILEFVKPANGLTNLLSMVQTLLQSSLLALFLVALNRKFKR